MVGILLSYGEGLFSGAMLVFGGVFGALLEAKRHHFLCFVGGWSLLAVLQVGSLDAAEALGWRQPSGRCYQDFLHPGNFTWIPDTFKRI